MTPVSFHSSEVLKKNGQVNLFALIGVGLALTLVVSQLYLIAKQLRQIDEQKIASAISAKKQIELEHNLRTLMGKDYQELYAK